jgi:invasion protein IalB
MPNETPLYQRFERPPPAAARRSPSWGHPAPAACAALLTAGLLAAGLAAGPGGAAEAPPGAVAAAGIAVPQPRLERHRDWRLDCRAACRIETRVPGAEGGDVLRLDVPGGVPLLRVATNLPLFLPEPVEIRAGADAFRLPWLTCGPDGCEARAALDEVLLAALRREREAQVAFTLIDGTRVRVPVSLMGFTAAKAALEARAE